MAYMDAFNTQSGISISCQNFDFKNTTDSVQNSCRHNDSNPTQSLMTFQ